MNDYEFTDSPPSRVGNVTALRRLLNWWRNHDSHERYLADATDHADLERRQRELERTSTGPAFETFNH